MMTLKLINDLPLFSMPADAPGFDETVRVELEAAASRFPAETSLVGFEDLRRTWAAVTSCAAADVTLLVGTRPPLLEALIPAKPNADRIVQVSTSREHDSSGQTAIVRITGTSDLDALHNASHLLVADDVAMSAVTLRAVLHCGLIDASTAVSVRIAFATAAALCRLRLEFPLFDIHAESEMDFAPVTEGTAIFLSALFFGTLRGRPFLCQRELLAPFFGADLGPLHELRDGVRELLLDTPVFSSKAVVTDDGD
jgi:hypothetical protein